MMNCALFSVQTGFVGAMTRNGFGGCSGISIRRCWPVSTRVSSLINPTFHEHAATGRSSNANSDCHRAAFLLHVCAWESRSCLDGKGPAMRSEEHTSELQ